MEDAVFTLTHTNTRHDTIPLLLQWDLRCSSFSVVTNTWGWKMNREKNVYLFKVERFKRMALAPGFITSRYLSILACERSHRKLENERSRSRVQLVPFITICSWRKRLEYLKNFINPFQMRQPPTFHQVSHCLFGGYFWVGSSCVA